MALLETAWDEYRGWAARARELQQSSQRWNKAALISAAAAAILAAAATQTAGHPAGKVFSFLAAVAAALTPILGREILSLAAEASWIRARAAAEAIKSACYRYAARAGDYSAGDPDALLAQQLDALSRDAEQAQLTPRAVENGAKNPPPPDHFEKDWYIANRIDDQIKYYRTRQGDHERAIKVLRTVVFAAAAIGALFGIAGVSDQGAFAPWVGALTTIATAVAANGALDRRQSLAATYSAVATSLGRLKARAESLALSDLVVAAEDMMQAEHGAWTVRMTQTIARPPGAQPPKADEKKAGG